jgi:hypothetical protein
VVYRLVSNSYSPPQSFSPRVTARHTPAARSIFEPDRLNTRPDGDVGKVRSAFFVMTFPDSPRHKAEAAAVRVQAGQRPPRTRSQSLDTDCPSGALPRSRKWSRWFCPCASRGSSGNSSLAQGYLYAFTVNRTFEGDTLGFIEIAPIGLPDSRA